MYEFEFIEYSHGPNAAQITTVRIIARHLQMLIAAKRITKAFMTGPSDFVSATIIFRTAAILPNILRRKCKIYW